jgi:hypothetical protein
LKKPQFIEGYDAGFTRDCERVLVTLLRGLGPLRSSIYLIGGLTPRYLVSAKPPDIPPHAGTGDLDLVIDMSILAGAEAYRTLEENLKHMGFERWVNDECIPVSWRWRTKTEAGRTVVIDFLTYDPLRADKRMVEVETAGEVTALNVPYADLVYALHDELKVTAELLGENGVVTETIAHANRVSFTCLKSFAFADRFERKDAHDLFYCLEHGKGGIEAAAEEFVAAASGPHWAAIAAALRALHAHFADEDEVAGYRKDGPVAVAKFEIGEEPEVAEQRALRQRQVTDLVSRFLGLLEAIWREH